MHNILAVLGSARKNGNTEQLIREALRGAGAGTDAEVYRLNDMKIYGCQGCKGCKVHGSDGCILQDDMQAIYEHMKTANAVILGSPVYYGEVTGQMKVFMDRWYGLRDGEGNLRMPEGRKLLFIMVQGAEQEDWYKSTVARLKKVIDRYGFDTEILVAAGLEGKGEASERPDIMKKAFLAGARLAG